MRTHPDVGLAILRHIDFLDDAKAVVRHHHERWDGTGYPDGLCAEAIPVPARVFALADTLDAITSERPVPRSGLVRGCAQADRPRGGDAVRPRCRGRLRDRARRRVRAHPGRAGVTHTILIVDDDPVIRKLITTTLQDVAGFRMTGSSSTIRIVWVTPARPGRARTRRRARSRRPFSGVELRPRLGDDQLARIRERGRSAVRPLGRDRVERVPASANTRAGTGIASTQTCG